VVHALLSEGVPPGTMRSSFQNPRGLWRRLDRSLRARVLLPTSVLFAATLTLMVGAAVQIHSAELERSARDRAELFANMAADGVVNAVSSGDTQDVPNMLAVMKEHRSDIDSIALMAPDGTVRYSTLPGLVGQRPWPAGELEAKVVVLPQHPHEFVALRPLLVDPCAHCSADPITAGWLEIRFSRSAQEQAKRRLTRTLALAALPSLALLLGITWWLIGREAIGPVRRLVKAMRIAAAGHLDVVSDEGRPDELGVAARGFDAVLSALRKSQLELEAVYKERIARADRFALVGEMAAGLAHEIRNPLAGLSGALELLAEDVSNSPRQAEVVAEMQNEVKRLGRIMDGLLGFARPHKAVLEYTHVNDCLERVIFLLDRQKTDRVTLERAFGQHLPAVWADSGQLEQVFLNISLNACQAIGSKGGTLTLRTFVAEGGVGVEFADTGPGIPAEARPHLFTPFFTTRNKGNGLGLAISERIVTAHGGRISFNCPPGGGTVFRVSLPAAQAREDAA